MSHASVKPKPKSKGRRGRASHFHDDALFELMQTVVDGASHQRDLRAAVTAPASPLRAPSTVSASGAMDVLRRLEDSADLGRAFELLVLLRDVRRNTCSTSKAKTLPVQLILRWLQSHVTETADTSAEPTEEEEIALTWLTLLSTVSGSLRDLSHGFVPLLRSLGLATPNELAHSKQLDAHYGLALLHAALCTAENGVPEDAVLDLALGADRVAGRRSAAAGALLKRYRMMRSEYSAKYPTLERLLNEQESRAAIATEARKLTAECAGARHRHRAALKNEPRAYAKKKLHEGGERFETEASRAMAARVQEEAARSSAATAALLAKMQAGQKVSAEELDQVAASTGALSLVEKMRPLYEAGEPDPLVLNAGIAHISQMAMRIRAASFVVSVDHSGSMGSVVQSASPRQSADLLAMALANMPCQSHRLPDSERDAFRELISHAARVWHRLCHGRRAPTPDGRGTACIHAMKIDHIARMVYDFLGADNGFWRGTIIGFGARAEMTRMPPLEGAGLHAQLRHVSALECGLTTNVGAMFTKVLNTCLAEGVQPPEVIWVLTDGGFNTGLSAPSSLPPGQEARFVSDFASNTRSFELGCTLGEIVARQRAFRLAGLIPPTVVVHNMHSTAGHSHVAVTELHTPNVVYLEGTDDAVVQKVLDSRALRALQRDQAQVDVFNCAPGQLGHNARHLLATLRGDGDAGMQARLLRQRFEHWSNAPLHAAEAALRAQPDLRRVFLFDASKRMQVRRLLSDAVSKGRRDTDPDRADPAEVVAEMTAILTGARGGPVASAEEMAAKRALVGRIALRLAPQAAARLNAVAADASADRATVPGEGACKRKRVKQALDPTREEATAVLQLPAPVVTGWLRAFAFAQTALCDHARTSLAAVRGGKSGDMGAFKWLASERTKRSRRHEDEEEEEE